MFSRSTDHEHEHLFLPITTSTTHSQSIQFTSLQSFPSQVDHFLLQNTSIGLELPSPFPTIFLHNLLDDNSTNPTSPREPPTGHPASSPLFQHLDLPRLHRRSPLPQPRALHRPPVQRKHLQPPSVSQVSERRQRPTPRRLRQRLEPRERRNPPRSQEIRRDRFHLHHGSRRHRPSVQQRPSPTLPPS